MSEMPHLFIFDVRPSKRSGSWLTTTFKVQAKMGHRKRISRERIMIGRVGQFHEIKDTTFLSFLRNGRANHNRAGGFP